MIFAKWKFFFQLLFSASINLNTNVYKKYVVCFHNDIVDHVNMNRNDKSQERKYSSGLSIVSTVVCGGSHTLRTHNIPTISCQRTLLFFMVFNKDGDCLRLLGSNLCNVCCLSMSSLRARFRSVLSFRSLLCVVASLVFLSSICTSRDVELALIWQAWSH